MLERMHCAAGIDLLTIVVILIIAVDVVLRVVVSVGVVDVIAERGISSVRTGKS